MNGKEPGITPTPAKLKLPLRYQEESDAYTHIIRDRDNVHVVQFPQDSKGESESQARYFVEAVNSHASLVSRVTELEKALRYVLKVRQIECLHAAGFDEICANCVAKSALEAK